MVVNRAKAGGACVAPAASSEQYLSFVLGGAAYAISIFGIKEIIQYGDVSEVPGMPQFIRGVTDLRGEVLPVIDLGACFGRGVSPQARSSCIVVMEVEVDDARCGVGVMVDAVNAVLEIDDADIKVPPAFGSRVRADFIKGMARINERIVVLLDISAALSPEQFAVMAGLDVFLTR